MKSAAATESLRRLHSAGSVHRDCTLWVLSVDSEVGLSVFNANVGCNLDMSLGTLLNVFVLYSLMCL